MPNEGSTTYKGLLIETDQPCRNCGYSLKGLMSGSLCPECGTSIRSPRSQRLADNITDAPLHYLRKLAWGTTLMALAVLILGALVAGGLGTMLVAIFGAVSGGGYSLGGGALGLIAIANAILLPVLWPLGIYLTACPRPEYEARTPDPVLDRPHFRRCTYAAGVLLPGIVLSTVAAGFASGTLSVVLLVLASLCVLAMLPALVPMAVYLAAIADWAGDTGLSGRLRASAWGICVFGTLGLGAVVLAVLPLGISPMGNLVAPIMMFLLMLCTAAVLVCIVQLAMNCRWAVHNSINRMERDTRIAERRQRHAEEMAERSTGQGTQDPANAIRPDPAPYDPDEAIPMNDAPVAPAAREPSEQNEVPLPLTASDEDPPGMERLDPEHDPEHGPEHAPAQAGKPSITHTPSSISARRRGRREDSADTGPDEGGTGAPRDWGH